MIKKRKIKFDEPIKTKSGRSVVELWNELKEQKKLYSKYTYLEKNQELRLIAAKQIRHLEDDIGMTQTNFSELGLQNKPQLPFCTVCKNVRTEFEICTNCRKKYPKYSN